MVRRKLEQDFGLDLSERKPFLREQVSLFLQSRYESSQQDEEEEDDDDDDETAKSKSDGCEDDDDEGDELNNGKGSKRG